jgi:hypothetical protein
MKNTGNTRLAIVMMAVAFFAGCTAGPEQGSVKIVSIKPDQNSTIRVDDRMDVEVTVEYTLKSGKGEISLLIQNENAPVAGRHIDSAEQEVTATSGTITLKKSVIVPETTKIGVYTPMYLGGVYKKTLIVDSKTYKVVPKK